jgi:hypothetical protein
MDFLELKMFESHITRTNISTFFHTHANYYSAYCLKIIKIFVVINFCMKF